MRIFMIMAAVFVLVGCNNEEIGNSSDVNPERIFFDYKINGEEDRDYVTVLLQYRFAGPEGTTLVLNPPSKVELDGTPLLMDSSKMTGAFFEHHVAKSDFTGVHKITFTDIKNKSYTETFEFVPLELKEELPKVISRGGIEIMLTGLKPIDAVRIVMTDTSFYSKGINRIDTVKNGVLTLTRSDFSALVNGPVTLELAREVERPLKETTEEGGSFALTYSLRREFLLVNGE